MSLWCCTLTVLAAAVVADARSLSLRHRSVPNHRHVETAEHAVSPCALWLQEHASQAPAAVAAAGAPPCPCLVTLPPLMTSEQTQAAEVKAAADNAMLKGLTQIQEAAKTASDPVMKELEALDAKQVETVAKVSLDAVEKNQTGNLKTMLDAEKARQVKELEAMESSAQMVAQLTADHVRQTTEQWAENQARNYIVQSANGTLGDALRKDQQIMKIRQEATELTKGAINSANESLALAKRAQEAILLIPKDSMDKAKKHTTEMEGEQAKLNVEIEATESSVRTIASVSAEGYDTALRTLQEADEAEKTAREALETSRSNAAKIEKLKTRAQAVAEKAASAKKELELSNQ